MLFVLLLRSPSICYANNDDLIMTVEEAQILQNMPNIVGVTVQGYNAPTEVNKNKILNGLNSVTSNDIANYFNNTILSVINSDSTLRNLNLKKQQIVFQFYGNNNDNYVVIRIYFTNSGIGDTLGFINAVPYQTRNYTVRGYADYIYFIEMTINNGVISHSAIDFLNTRGGTDFGYGYVNIDDTLIDINSFCGYSPIVSFYYNNQPYILKYNIADYIVEPDEPSESGDSGTGTTGNIYNNSGDKTGTIDLSNIENGIGNINSSINEQGQAIVENQNQNTETIVNTISGEVNKITNTLTDEPNLEDTNITSGDIERCFRF